MRQALYLFDNFVGEIETLEEAFLSQKYECAQTPYYVTICRDGTRHKFRNYEEAFRLSMEPRGWNLRGLARTFVFIHEGRIVRVVIARDIAEAATRVAVSNPGLMSEGEVVDFGRQFADGVIIYAPAHGASVQPDLDTFFGLLPGVQVREGTYVGPQGETYSTAEEAFQAVFEPQGYQCVLCVDDGGCVPLGPPRSPSDLSDVKKKALESTRAIRNMLKFLVSTESNPERLGVIKGAESFVTNSLAIVEAHIDLT